MKGGEIMSGKLNTKSVALTTGVFFAILHTIGVIGLFVGLMKYWQWVHFVNVTYTLQPFSLLPFVLGIVTAFVVGMVVGSLFAVLYNKRSD